jgi:hypothetical protein
VNLPAPVRVPCNVTCTSGTFFNANTSTCEACVAGTYTVPNQVVVQQFDKLPPGFSTYCERFIFNAPSCNAYEFIFSSHHVKMGFTW